MAITSGNEDPYVLRAAVDANWPEASPVRAAVASALEEQQQETIQLLGGAE